jgi:cell division septal protein FtsQ
VAEQRFLLFPQSNVLAFSTSTALRTIGSEFSFAEVRLDKRIPHSLELAVAEKQPVAALLTNTRLYAIDQEGTIIRELTTDELDRTPHLPEGAESVQADKLGVEAFEIGGTGTAAAGNKPTAPAKPTKNLLPVIVAEGTVKPGKTAVSKEALHLVRAIDDKIEAAAKAIPLWYTVDEDSQSVDVAMDGGWHAYWSALLPYQAQADRLGITLTEKVGDKLPTLEYIDLRYDEKIFLRYRQEAPKTGTTTTAPKK